MDINELETATRNLAKMLGFDLDECLTKTFKTKEELISEEVEAGITSQEDFDAWKEAQEEVEK